MTWEAFEPDLSECDEDREVGDALLDDAGDGQDAGDALPAEEEVLRDAEHDLQKVEGVHVVENLQGGEEVQQDAEDDLQRALPSEVRA